MKKMNTTLGALSMGLLLSMSLQASDAMKMVEAASKLDVKKVCDVKSQGLDKVVATAAKYNPAAVKLGVEFKRLGITNRVYIKGLEAALKQKPVPKKVTLQYKSKGKTKSKTFPIDYAAWRSCTFSVRALQQVTEADKTWRMAVPGDGFK
ncbi:hypothetical protein [Nitratifractor sp.]